MGYSFAKVDREHRHAQDKGWTTDRGDQHVRKRQESFSYLNSYCNEDASRGALLRLDSYSFSVSWRSGYGPSRITPTGLKRSSPYRCPAHGTVIAIQGAME